MGGEDNEAKTSFSVHADYYINQNTALTGEGKAQTEILGKPFTVNGSLTAGFDPLFNLLPGATATLGATVEIPLEEKTLASKTIVVYGVPVTLAVDLGGNVQVFVNGTVVFDQQFRFLQAHFVPGTTITLDITASAAAATGLAKVGVRGSPTGTLKIKITYTTAGGIVYDTFGGEISVPLTVFGSLFWDAVSGDLASTVIGPYTVGNTGIQGMSVPLAARSVLEAPKRFYATSSLAVNPGGKKLLVYTRDVSTSATTIDPEVAYRLDTGSGFGDPAAITSGNNFFELDPKVTFLGGDTALAVWTRNKGAKTLNHLNDIMKNQDIAYAYYNGTAWSAEGAVIT
ncbi:MAG: hypothetical protein N2Z74_10545, partial [Syntrophales bacterium]|nr:hypothetical protein [Syntrophales bacterium]